MGFFRAVGLMAGLMIGSGIFYVGAFVLDYVNLSTGMALLAWLLAGLMSTCAGLCYAEMGTAMPRSGGSYVYVTESFGPMAGFTMGWTGFTVRRIQPAYYIIGSCSYHSITFYHQYDRC